MRSRPPRTARRACTSRERAPRAEARAAEASTAPRRRSRGLSPGSPCSSGDRRLDRRGAAARVRRHGRLERRADPRVAAPRPRRHREDGRRRTRERAEHPGLVEHPGLAQATRALHRGVDRLRLALGHFEDALRDDASRRRAAIERHPRRVPQSRPVAPGQREGHLRREPRVDRAVRPGDHQGCAPPRHRSRRRAPARGCARAAPAARRAAPSTRSASSTRPASSELTCRAASARTGSACSRRDDAPLDEIAEPPHPAEALGLGEPPARSRTLLARRSAPKRSTTLGASASSRVDSGAARLDWLAVVGHELQQQHEGLGIRRLGEQRARHRASRLDSRAPA